LRFTCTSESPHHILPRVDRAQIDVARERHIAAGFRGLQIGGREHRPRRQLRGPARLRTDGDGERAAAAAAFGLLPFQLVAERVHACDLFGVEPIREHLRVGIELAVQREHVLGVGDLVHDKILELLLAVGELHADPQGDPLRLRPDRSRQLDRHAQLPRIGAGEIDLGQLDQRRHRHAAAGREQYGNAGRDATDPTQTAHE
jgi:hypothetical protein